MWWPTIALLCIVAAILVASHQRALQPVFRWLPTPLWCYALPMIAVALGWLPRDDAGYRWLTEHLLPIALALLIVGMDLPAVVRIGSHALLAMSIGIGGIILGVSMGVALLHHALPLEAWKGAGALTGTWTGGTMNLLSLRSILRIPDAVFAPLIVVDALIAYSWMALLIAASSLQQPINRWLRAEHIVSGTHPQNLPVEQTPCTKGRLVTCLLLAIGLTLAARLVARALPTSIFVSSANGWTILLVTSCALSLSLLRPMRRLGAHGGLIGYPCLYIVLAATGAQASLQALWSAPTWMLVGLIAAMVHGAMLLIGGRCLRIPLSILATASQANIGGVVSAPLVGAIYEPSLAPVGLLLAMAANALGTYLGVSAAILTRWLIHGAG